MHVMSCLFVISDTIQIAILPSKTDESKPLHLEKGSDAASSINTLTAEPTVKYRVSAEVLEIRSWLHLKYFWSMYH